MSKHPAEITISQASDAAVHLLGGAQRVRTRVRGFAPWLPEQATLALLDQVRGVLDEYEAYLPLSIRQIFYRLSLAPTITRRPSLRISGSPNISTAPAGPASFRWTSSATTAASSPSPMPGGALSSSWRPSTPWQRNSRSITAPGRQHGWS